MGTILILLMTVVLFSTIIIWVTGLPSPQSSSRLDMEAKFTPIYNTGAWYGGIITITHRGGASLYDYQVRLYLTINNNIEILKLRGTNFDGISVHTYGIDGPPPPDNDWNLGETWSYTNNSIPANPKISIIIADITRSAVLWQQDIIGFPGTQPPIFVAKWTDSNPATPSYDPIQPGNTFTLYAKVIDPDGDLKANSVYAAFTFGGLGTLRMYDDGTHGDAQAGDGIFSLAIATPAASSWDGGVVVMNATDQGGLQTQSRFVLSVVNLGNTNIFNNNTPQTGPLNLTKFNDLQRYDIFNKTQWDKFSWSATPTRTFKQGETVVVVVASKYLVNVDLSNQFIVYDTTSGTQQPLVYGGGNIGTNTFPSSNAAFTFNSVQAGYNIFIYKFSTKASDYGFGGGQMFPGQYPVSFNLQTGNVPPPKNRFSANDQITVCPSSGGCPTYPQLLTYKDPAMTRPAGLFSFTQTMYVKIVVKDTDASFTIGSVQVQDYIGDTQILAAPGASPVSAAQINDTTSYKFSVDLSKPNLDNWLFGNNSYNFNVLGVKDANEYYNLLATQVRVLGPRWSLDAALGTLAQLHQNFGTTTYGNFYPNELAFTPIPLDTIAAAPGSKAPLNPITALAFGDMDANGDLDIVAGQDVAGSGTKVTGNVEWFRNTNGLGYSATGTTAWEKIIIDTLCPTGTTSPCITAIAVGHINKDPLLDIAVGTSTGDIWWYANDGFWTPHFVDNVGVRINALKLADLNGDGIADLVVGLQTTTNSIRVYINDGTGVFGGTTTTTTLMSADSGGLGTLGTDPVGLAPPYYLQTQTSNLKYETVQEAKVNYSVPTGEIKGGLESVVGSYVNVTTLDGQYETLTEGVSGTTYSLSNPATPNGHRWNYTNIWASATDTIEVHIHAGIIPPGFEPFSVRWSTSPTGPWNALGTIDSQTFGEFIFSFQPTSNINGGTVYISILDTDQSANDVNTDGILTSIQVDHAYLLITRSTGTGGATSHIWTTGVATASQDAYKFFVQGFHTSNNQGDDFNFRYATSLKGPYVDLLTLKAIGSSTTVSVSMPKSVGGKTLYIEVEDTNRGLGDSTLNTVEVDWMYINGYKATPVSYPLNPTIGGVGAATVSLAIADMDGDGHADIVAGLVGQGVRVYWNDGLGTSYSGPDVLTPPASVNSVDVGHLMGVAGDLYPDPHFDIAVALANNKVYGYAFSGIRGLWFASTLFDLSTTAATKIRVGDVDGDYWDDMVVMTSDNHLFELHNQRGTGFNLFTIDNVGATINDFDIGDVDRGVLATYATI